MDVVKPNVSTKTKEVLEDYSNYVAGGFAPYPVSFTASFLEHLSWSLVQIALARVNGWKAWDADGKEYLDFLSMYSVVNMGHGHPKILSAAIEAMQAGAVVNLPFHSPYYGKLAKKLHQVRTIFENTSSWNWSISLRFY